MSGTLPRRDQRRIEGILADAYDPPAEPEAG